jgi:hypothetical protein
MERPQMALRSPFNGERFIVPEDFTQETIEALIRAGFKPDDEPVITRKRKDN